MPWCHEETDKGGISRLRGGSPHSTAGHTGAGRGRAQLGSSGRVWDCRPPPRGRGTGLGGITTLLGYGQAGEGRKASAQLAAGGHIPTQDNMNRGRNGEKTQRLK